MGIDNQSLVRNGKRTRFWFCESEGVKGQKGFTGRKESSARVQTHSKGEDQPALSLSLSLSVPIKRMKESVSMEHDKKLHPLLVTGDLCGEMAMYLPYSRRELLLAEVRFTQVLVAN